MDAELPALESEQAARVAGDVLRQLLGTRPRRVKPLGGGLTNFVFAARQHGEDLIVRMSGNPAKVKEYLKEQWAMAQAREVGVPVPEVLEVGTGPTPYPYMITRHVAGVGATHHPEHHAVPHELGRLARLLHGVPTSGFGHTFEWSGNVLSRKDTWRDYLAREFRGEARLALLERQDMLPKHALKAVPATLRDVARWKPEPSLNHGDLRLKNVVVGADGALDLYAL